MRALPLILAALALITLAAAQDGSEMTNSRTPENARKFLAELPSRFEVLMVSKGNTLPNSIGYRVTHLRHDGQCKTTVEGIPNHYILQDSAGKMLVKGLGKDSDPGLFGPHQALLKFHGITEAPITVDWGGVDPIEQERGTSDGIEKRYPRNLTITGKALRMILILPSEEMANRAMLAMEALRADCDPMKHTGF